MVKQHNTTTDYMCAQCGSKLIFISEEKVQPEGVRSSQTNTVYRCSNEDCQRKRDKEKAERQKQYERRKAIVEEKQKEKRKGNTK